MNTITAGALTQDYKKAVETIKNVWADYENRKKAVNELHHVNHYKIQDEINALKSKQYELEREKSKVLESLEGGAKSAAEAAQETRKRVELIFRLMKAFNEKRQPNILKANNRGKFITQIDAVESETINIYAYIYENDNKVNKYSLGIAASHIFGDDGNNFYERGKGYFKPYFEGSGYSFELVVKDGASVKELEDFYNKKGLNGFWNVEEFKKVEELYNEAKTFAGFEWRKAYLEYFKSDYEQNWSSFEDQQEYKEIVNELNQIAI